MNTMSGSRPANGIFYVAIAIVSACGLSANRRATAQDGFRLDDRSPLYEIEPQKALDLIDEVTLEAWVQADRMTSAGGRVLDKTVPGTQLGYMLDTHPGNSLRLLNATGMCRFDARLPADRWTYVAGVFSASQKTMKLFMDGRAVAQRDGAFQPMTLSSVPLRVGADPSGGNRFHGRIKRAAIYNRALTAQEIRQRAAGNPPAPLDGVLGEWEFSARPGREIRPTAGTLVLRRQGYAAQFAGALIGEAPPPASALALWYRQPALQWSEALPIGNGRLGAMVFGGLDHERIQVNEDTVWTGTPHQYQHEGAAQYLPQIRQLLTEGKQREAEALAMQQFMSVPLHQKAYQPLGDVLIDFPPMDKVIDYRRELDLDTALSQVTYRCGDATFTRQAFASHPDQAIAWHISADRPGRISFTARLTSPHTMKKVAVLDGRTLVLTGQVEEGGISFEARLIPTAEGGRVSCRNGEIHVEGADSATLTLVAATNFVSYRDISADPSSRCAVATQALVNKNFSQLLQTHVSDHQRLFRRVTLDVGTSAAVNLPMDERVKQAAQQIDPQLATLYFQFGRYLLIAGSRPGTQPANLQGIWNELLNPPWDSKWTTNINTEMNYWPAEVCNLSECHEPLFDLIDDCAGTGRETARAHYGCRGWVLHHNTDLWRGTAPINHCQSRYLGHRRRLAVPAFVESLPLLGGQRVPRRARLPGHERGIHVLCRLPGAGRENRLADQRPLKFAGDWRTGDGAHHGSPDHSRPAGEHRRAQQNCSRSMPNWQRSCGTMRRTDRSQPDWQAWATPGVAGRQR